MKPTIVSKNDNFTASHRVGASAGLLRAFAKSASPSSLTDLTTPRPLMPNLHSGIPPSATGALVSLTTGVWDTAFGFQALNHTTTGHNNTGTGLRSLFSNTNGNCNTGHGVYSLYRNVNGLFNSANGAYTLSNNVSGDFNTATGYGVLWGNSAEQTIRGTVMAFSFAIPPAPATRRIGYQALSLTTARVLIISQSAVQRWESGYGQQ